MQRAETIFGPLRDKKYMAKALALAQRAFACDEVPVGAIVVAPDGVIIGSGYNQVEKRKTVTAHAEIRALAAAGKKRGDWRLDGCWIYVTLEPCSLCMAALQMSRVAGIVYSAMSPLFSYRLDNQGNSWVYRKNTPLVLSMNDGDQTAATLLKSFFKKKRKVRE